MSPYEKFCYLRDFRAPGTEAPKYTEAEAFALAIGAGRAANAPTRLYLAGPMVGIPLLNFPKFHAEAARLRGLGFDVVNPAEFEEEPAAWATPQQRIDRMCARMRAEVAQVLHCDSVALLDGWTSSARARLVQHVALEVGMAPRLAAFFVNKATEEREIALQA